LLWRQVVCAQHGLAERGLHTELPRTVCAAIHSAAALFMHQAGVTGVRLDCRHLVPALINELAPGL
jgi:hypothetical protein